ncbi:mitochondrial import receptor subunit TOM70 isoform X2 [Ischnura elegans]|uniref:mitochondrial import receptor subunit TOM70 isoform X2 n=1 Tax=Ischnura elegans TaxID=197161 RepID=UPI001ED8B4C8|nr:mitochondrial import receptor subunit TOM70 isoform X2 [Ischnura elegans]
MFSVMAAASRSGVDGHSWSKWQIALVVGAPVAIGLGYWYLRNTGSSSDRQKCQLTGKKKTNVQSVQTTNNGAARGADDVNSSNTSQEASPFDQSQDFKKEGNRYFKDGKYSDAIRCYNAAIDACPKEKVYDLSTFYQNRAAAYEQLKDYESSKDDCTKALELNPTYVKALHRRAKAYESTSDLKRCLEDVTAACLLDHFQNQAAIAMADRVLRELGQQHAKDAMAKRGPVIPSKHFVKTYFSSFHSDPLSLPISKGKEADPVLNGESEPKSGFLLAIEAFQAQRYDEIIPACTEEINAENSKYKLEALSLRATFFLLRGEYKVALADLEKVIENKDANVELRVNALIKRASLHMQMEDPPKAIEDFNRAAELGPGISDVYHHRGQVFLLMDKAAEAQADFKKAVDLSPEFPIAYVQKCYADYRYACMEQNIERAKKAIEEFEEAIRKFPKCSECCTLYAQVLNEQQEYEKADNYYKKAIEIDPENAALFVHRGLLQLNWKGDVDKAIYYIRKSLEMDDKCEFAYETLGTIEVQRGNFLAGAELFDKAIQLVKTDVEMSHLFSLKDAAKAQAVVVEKYKIPMPDKE